MTPPTFFMICTLSYYFSLETVLLNFKTKLQPQGSNFLLSVLSNRFCIGMLLSKKFLVLRLQLLGKMPTKLRNTKPSMLESTLLMLQSWNVCHLRLFCTNFIILLKSGMHSASHIHRNLKTLINIQFFWDWKIMFFK